MSNIEDRDEQTYLNGFEEQPELPYDWDSEEAQGTAEELKAEAQLTGEQRERMLWRSGVSAAFAAGLENRAYTVPTVVVKERGTRDQVGYYGDTEQFVAALGEAFDAGVRVNAILNA